jgi:ATPase subunit of ABC transporter with duplicated ATPase domains
MADSCLTLDGVSFALPDGTVLFSNLTARFDTTPTGLVGRNGVGKSVLARLLAGQLQPAAGRCQRSGKVHYLAQHVGIAPEATVASLAGVEQQMNALQRIEAGSSAIEDFDSVGEGWDLPQRLQHELQQNGLGHLEPNTPAARLSGGEAMRVALLGAALAQADFLILDEPSNHLDRDSRLALVGHLQSWRGGLLVISHDRQLLAGMARIVELSSLGLRSYGGGYEFYQRCKALEREQAQQQLDQCKHARKKQQQVLREQQQRSQHRQAHGSRAAGESNQAKILLGRQKQRSQASAGKLNQQHAAALERLDAHVREAAGRLEPQAPIAVHGVDVDARARQRVAELQQVRLPFISTATRHISLSIGARQRVGVVGGNGCGKSTLLKVLAGQLARAAGHCQLCAHVAWLDQRLCSLQPGRSALQQLQAANPAAELSQLRTRLAQLGLDARQATAPSEHLSGGERLKAALACVLYAAPAPQLLLLDEPSNHLDLPSLQALEAMLRAYEGALVVVSHDDVFLGNIALTDRLVGDERGWRLEAWRKAPCLEDRASPRPGA